MRVIGITGGIASGKSVLSAYIRSLGYTVFDADACSVGLTRAGGEALAQIESCFGAEFIKDGAMDRARMSKEVFDSPQKRRMLENIIHPLVISRCKEKMRECANEQLFFIDAPLLLESGMDEMCDEVWLIYAPERVRIERACARSGMEPQQVRKRIRSQMPFYLKKRRADHIIDNGGSLETAMARVTRLINRAVKKCGVESV